jgi:hypothetical protein
MTNPAPISRLLAPSVLALGAVLTAANWYVDPGRRGAWIASAVLFGSLALVHAGAGVLATRGAGGRHGARFIRTGVLFGAVIPAVSLALRLASTLGVAADPDLRQRMTMVLLGAFFVYMGNTLPKMLTPMSAGRCDPAAVQARTRFSAWTWVLTGLAYMLIWIVLPVDVAEPASLAAVALGGIAIFAHVIRWHQVPRTGG